jgi:protein SCO1/2
MRSPVLATALFVMWVGSSVGALAQGYSAEQPLGATAQSRPAYLAHAGIEQRLGQPLPLTAIYTDETGATAPLSAWFHGKPVVMAEVYYKCAMLCPQVLHGLATGLSQTTLHPGKDYQVLIFSIDPTDKPADAATEKATFLKEAGLLANPDAVHFLTAAEPSIRAMSDATGFHYVMVPGPDGKLNQFAHSSVIMFATPNGRMSKYLSGIDYPARDLRLALLDASGNKISNPVDLLILYCCSYSPTVGRYSVSVLRILSIAGLVTLFVVIGMVILLTRKPRSMTA